MKNFIRTSLCLGALITAVGIGSASAQVVEPIQFHTNFPFTVANTTLPAGSYDIRTPDDESGVLELRSADGKTGVFFEVEGVTAKTPPKNEIVFKRYGNHYVLKDVFVEGEQSGAEVTMSRAETHHAKHNGSPTERRLTAMKIGVERVAKSGK